MRTIHVVHIELFLPKVETIGDTYMLVAGLPNRLHLTHAEVVARSALALLSASLDFTIPHMPEARLQLRIGLHSGKYCANITVITSAGNVISTNVRTIYMYGVCMILYILYVYIIYST